MNIGISWLDKTRWFWIIICIALMLIAVIMPIFWDKVAVARIDAALMAASASYESGNYEDVLNYADCVASLTRGRDYRSEYIKGDAFTKLNKYEDAQRAYESALRLIPHFNSKGLSPLSRAGLRYDSLMLKEKLDRVRNKCQWDKKEIVSKLRAERLLEHSSK